MGKIRSDVSAPKALIILVIGVATAVALPHISFMGILVWPLNILATLIHEGSHGLMALLTGGSIVSVTINTDGSGSLSNSGGSRALVLFAGYLGTNVFGFLLLVTAVRVGLSRLILGVMGTLFILLVVLYGKFGLFTIASGICAGVFFLLVAYKIESHFAIFISAFLGANIVMNAFNDLLYLVVASSNGLTESDAGFMSNEFGLPATFWAVLWMGMSLCFLIFGSYSLITRVRSA